MEHVIRPVRADEWRQARDFRLDSLRDPAASVAFLDTYEEAVSRPDSWWQERAAGVAEGSGLKRQFVAETPAGDWVGSLTVLVERAGVEVAYGTRPLVDQAHVVGVFVRPAARGRGVTEALFQAGVEWAWSLELPPGGGDGGDGVEGTRIERVRLYVHERNGRAEAFYRKVGFLPSGDGLPAAGDASGALELEYEVLRPTGV
ncbi:GNAT family N-acetyltransferase [Streptomyces sp. NPDC047097]|uniref:GNAT family N-acetyltransferase n=1 Tax=Streptomyces sp. NPDC047097 TaxID=3155260 RepID=UPI0033F16C74